MAKSQEKSKLSLAQSLEKPLKTETGKSETKNTSIERENTVKAKLNLVN